MNKRHVAVPVWASAILTAAFEQSRGEFDFPSLLVGEHRVHRCKMIATVVDTFHNDEKQFATLVKTVKDEKDPKKKIQIVAVNYNQVLLNSHKGFLTLLRADAYAEIVKSIFKGIKEKETGQIPATEPGKQPEKEETILDKLLDDAKKIELDKAREVKNIGKDYPVFTFNDGKFNDDLHYTFSGDSWYFSEDGKRWIPVGYASYKKTEIDKEIAETTLVCEACGKGLINRCDEKECNEIGLKTENGCTFIDQFGPFNSCITKGNIRNLPSVPSDVLKVVDDVDVANRQIDKDQEFIKSLQHVSYEKGLSLLMTRTRQDKEGGLIDPVLSTESVDYSKNGAFAVKKEEITIYLDMPSTRWRWSPDKNFKDFVVISEFEVPEEGIPETEIMAGSLRITLFGINAELVNSIKNKNSLEGAAIIFSIDTESGTVPATKTTTPETQPETPPTTSDLKDRKSIVYNFDSSVDLPEMIAYMKKASQNSYVGRTCNCGPDCDSYAKLILDASKILFTNIIILIY